MRRAVAALAVLFFFSCPCWAQDTEETNSELLDEIRLAVISTNVFASGILSSLGYSLEQLVFERECKFRVKRFATLIINGSKHQSYISGRVKFLSGGDPVDCDYFDGAEFIINRSEISGSGYIRGKEANAKFSGSFSISGNEGYLFKMGLFDSDFSNYFFVNGKGKLTQVSYGDHSFPNVTEKVERVRVDVSEALDIVEKIYSKKKVTLGDTAKIVKGGSITVSTPDCPKVKIRFNGSRSIQVSSGCTTPSAFKVNLDTGRIVR